jgi:hypothetical protein
MNNKYYDKIYVIQSYPNLHFLTNKLYNEKCKVAVIVSLDKSIFKFFKKLKIKNIDIYNFGNAKIYRHSIFSPIRKLYTNFLWYKIPKLRTKTLCITYANWADIGAFYIKKIDFKYLEQYIPSTEERYDVISNPNKKLNGFLKFVYDKTDGLIENKIYENEIKGKKIKINGVGLKCLKSMYPKIKIENVKESNLINDKVFDSYFIDEPFYIFVDKDLIKSKQISWLKLFNLYRNVNKVFKRKKIKIGFKFKPRHYSVIKYFLLKLIGFHILNTESPSQIFINHPKCIGVIGFTSSSMSVKYKKKIISLSSLENTFRVNLTGNIESMNQRNSYSDKIVFIKNLSELSENIN